MDIGGNIASTDSEGESSPSSSIPSSLSTSFTWDASSHGHCTKDGLLDEGVQSYKQVGNQKKTIILFSKVRLK